MIVAGGAGQFRRLNRADVARAGVVGRLKPTDVAVGHLNTPAAKCRWSGDYAIIGSNASPKLRLSDYFQNAFFHGYSRRPYQTGLPMMCVSSRATSAGVYFGFVEKIRNRPPGSFSTFFTT
jgi:hypothetical protein